MPCKKKRAIPGIVLFNKLAAGIPEKREKIITQIEFRNDLLESEIISYKSELDRLQGAKKLPGLDVNTKTRMQYLQKKARQSLKGSPSHRIYFILFIINC